MLYLPRLPVPLLLVLTATCSLAANRLSAVWQSTQLGGGGYILNVYQAPSAPDVFYTHVDVGGIYRSDDGAKSWRMMHGNLPALPGITEIAGLNVDPRDADTVLAAIGSEWFPPHGLYRTTDGGRSWEKVLSARFYGNHPFRADGQVLARSPANPDLLIAGSGGGVFRSTDAGLSWSPAGLPDVNPVHVQFSPHDPDIVWLCAQPWKPNQLDRRFAGGFYLSDDAGLTWKKLSDESPTELAARADVSELLGLFNANDLRLSRDGGATWRPFDDGLAYGSPKNPGRHDTEDRTNVVAAGPGFWLTASRLGTFYRRAFDAAVWEKIERTGLNETAFGRPWWGRSTVKQRRHFGAALGSVWLDPRDPARWIFTDWYGLWRTSDAGATWTLSLDGIESTCVHHIEPDPVAPGRLHLGYWDLGYVVSDDAGATAHRERAGQVTANFKAIAVSPAAPALLLATGDGRAVGWAADTLWRSRDAGATWVKIPAPGDAQSARYNSVAAHPREPAAFYLAVSGPPSTGGGVYATRDGGETWTPVGSGLAEPAAPFFRADIAHHGPEIAVQRDGALVAISVDHRRVARLPAGADAWLDIPLPAAGQPRSVVADPHAKGRFFLSLAGGGLWRSEDDGATWRCVLAEQAGRVVIDPHVEGRVAVGTLASVWVSLDGGETWRDHGDGLPHRWYPVPAFSRDRLLVGTIGSGVFWRALEQKD
jgi:photosystem II stability/assembly factor-like uncharacterized protein